MNGILITLIGVVLQLQPATTGPSPVSFKGHRIGESVDAFVKAENAEARIAHCRAMLADQKTYEKVSRVNKCLSQSQPGFRCSLVTSDTNLLGLSVEFNGCIDTLTVIESGNGKYGVGTFESGKLVALELNFWNTPPGTHTYTFDSVLKDFITKLGDPSKTWTDEFQNGFGARFSARRASWSSPDMIVVLSEIQNGDGSCSATVTDRAFNDKLLKYEESRHKNALDP